MYDSKINSRPFLSSPIEISFRELKIFYTSNKKISIIAKSCRHTGIIKKQCPPSYLRAIFWFAFFLELINNGELWQMIFLRFHLDDVSTITKNHQFEYDDSNKCSSYWIIIFYLSDDVCLRYSFVVRYFFVIINWSAIKELSQIVAYFIKLFFATGFCFLLLEFVQNYLTQFNNKVFLYDRRKTKNLFFKYFWPE